MGRRRWSPGPRPWPRRSPDAQAARLALLDGYAGAVWTVDGTPRVVIGFTVEDSRIVEIELLADPEGLARLDLAPVGTEACRSTGARLTVDP